MYNVTKRKRKKQKKSHLICIKHCLCYNNTNPRGQWLQQWQHILLLFFWTKRNRELIFEQLFHLFVLIITTFFVIFYLVSSWALRIEITKSLLIQHHLSFWQNDPAKKKEKKKELELISWMIFPSNNLSTIKW